MNKASMAVGGHVWTMTYTIQDKSIVIHDFNPDDPEGYVDTRLNTLNKIEEDSVRCPVTVTINDIEYAVVNPQHIMTYRQPIG